MYVLFQQSRTQLKRTRMKCFLSYAVVGKVYDCMKRKEEREREIDGTSAGYRLLVYLSIFSLIPNDRCVLRSIRAVFRIDVN